MRSKRFAVVVGLVIAAAVVMTAWGTVVWWPTLAPGPTPKIIVPEYPQPRDNGFPRLVEASAPLRSLSGRGAPGDADPLDLPWDEPNSETARLLEKHAGCLSAARRALQKECLAPACKDLMDDVSYLHSLRALGSALILEGRSAESMGRYGEALAAYSDALRLGPIATRNSGDIGSLFGGEIVLRATSDLARCTGSGGLPRERLRQLAAFLDRASEEQVPWDETLAADWAARDATLARLQRGSLTMAELLGPPETGRHWPRFGQRWLARATRFRLQETFLALIEEAKKPYWQQRYAAPAPQPLLDGAFALDVGGSRWRPAAADAAITGSRVHAAIQLFRKQHEALPKALSDLVPDYLGGVPIDPFDGRPFRYRRTSSDYVLYSVGPDRKDSGGRKRITSARWETVGDLVIWPWE